MVTGLGQYFNFVVTPKGVQTLITNVINDAFSNEAQAVYAQLAPIGACDACASGVSLYCTTIPKFRFVIRLDWTLGYAAEVERVAADYAVERRGDQQDTSRWLVTLSSPADRIAVTLYQILREICGCDDGERTYVYYPDPHSWPES